MARSLFEKALLPQSFVEPRSIIATETGMAITYSCKHERIAFWKGSPEQIPEEQG